jgi:hypothetical protein
MEIDVNRRSCYEHVAPILTHDIDVRPAWRNSSAPGTLRRSIFCWQCTNRNVAKAHTRVQSISNINCSSSKVSKYYQPATGSERRLNLIFLTMKCMALRRYLLVTQDLTFYASREEQQTRQIWNSLFRQMISVRHSYYVRLPVTKSKDSLLDNRNSNALRMTPQLVLPRRDLTASIYRNCILLKFGKFCYRRKNVVPA